MSEVLITGATGTVGWPIARDLLARGDSVRALVRDVERARTLLPEGVEPVPGDVADRESVRKAVAGAEIVYHAAGLPEQWRRDDADFTRVNVEGTRNVAEEALAAGVRRLAYTSTIDVFRWAPGIPFDERVLDPDPRPTVYERSKQEADRIVVALMEQGLDAVFLHPSAVYGPVPALAVGLNDLIVRLATKKIPMLLPGGMPVVHCDDVAAAHIKAVGEAPAGSRFIIADRYLTLSEIAASVASAVPEARKPPVMPSAFARAVSAIGERVAARTGKPPLIPRGALIFLESHPVPDASRVRADLGIEITPWERGLAETVERFRAQGWRTAA
ncbi:MAG: NAD-dependent epimerase/dehydratase family protein [Solirubrobacterales bacterium]